jgi:hypothetical protein
MGGSLTSLRPGHRANAKGCGKSGVSVNRRALSLRLFRGRLDVPEAALVWRFENALAAYCGVTTRFYCLYLQKTVLLFCRRNTSEPELWRAVSLAGSFMKKTFCVDAFVFLAYR